MIIDLRSDTVTRPTPGMLQAMMQAPTGDDVFAEDPTINKLEARVAEIFGTEAGLYVPSGTMANQIAIRAQSGRLDELICHELSHIYNYETGGYASNAGLSVKLIRGDSGRMTPDQIRAAVQSDHDWLPETRVVSIENTCNKGGGSLYSLEQMQSVSKACRELGLTLHLDGARLYNALVAQALQPAQLHGLFDSISICFSKGLGAPVGSALLGSRGFIKQARRHRKVMGGGMRQAGILAAACLYALDNHVEGLRDDHRRAETLASALRELPIVARVLPVPSNIVLFDVVEDRSVSDLLSKLGDQNLLAVPFGPKTIRFVTHRDFDDNMLEEALHVLQGLS